MFFFSFICMICWAGCAGLPHVSRLLLHQRPGTFLDVERSFKTDPFPHFFCKSFFLSFCGWSLAQNDDINIYNWQFATIHILLVLLPVVFLGEGPDYIINNCQLSTIPLHFYPLSCGLNRDQLSIIPILHYLLSYVGKSLNCNITN